jgi:hypothetical protein
MERGKDSWLGFKNKSPEGQTRLQKSTEAAFAIPWQKNRMIDSGG